MTKAVKTFILFSWLPFEVLILDKYMREPAGKRVQATVEKGKTLCKCS